MASTESVLFDLDDTLCRYRRSSAELLAAAFDAAGVEPFFDAADYADRYGEFLGDSDSMTDLRERCFAAIARQAGRDPAVGRRVAAAYAAERDHTNVEPLPGAAGVVASFADRPIGLVTNGAPAMQAAKLEAIGLADAFDVVVHAGYETPAKPDPAPFTVALDALEAAPDTAVYVGNSLRTDVAGANAAGLRSVWLADPDCTDRSSLGPDRRPDHVIESLDSLPSVLGD